MVNWGPPRAVRHPFEKAVSFNPDVDLQKFITEFVCDTQQPVDVTHMQENIREL